MNKYAKTIIALIGALATWGVTAAADGVYDPVEWWMLLGALGTAAGVYFIPNREGSEASPNHPTAAAVPLADAATVARPRSLPPRKKAQPAKKAAKKRS